MSHTGHHGAFVKVGLSDDRTVAGLLRTRIQLADLLDPVQHYRDIR